MIAAGPLGGHPVDSVVLIAVTDPVAAELVGAKEGRRAGASPGLTVR